MNATITGNQLVLSSDTATVATAETFALTFVPDWVYPEIYVRAEQDDTRVEILVSEGSAVVPLGVGTWDISVVGRKNGTDLVTNKVKLYVDRPDIHHIVSEEQELYKPLIAPLSVSLTGFVAGSYLRYGKFYGELRVFVKVSKTTAMSGTTAIGTLPSGYRPTEAQTLPAYGTDGNVMSGVTVTIGTNGAVSVVGNVDANVVVMASYNSSNSQSGMITKNDIEKLVADWVDKTQSMITIGQSGSQELTSTEADLSLGTTKFMSGNKLTRSENGVLIGSGVNYVEVSGQMYINTGLTTGDTITLLVVVMKSGGTTSIISTFSTRCAGAALGMALAPAMRSVSEGDIIYLKAYNNTDARGTVPSYSNNTFLTVKVIA